MPKCKHCGKPVFTYDWQGFLNDYCERCEQALIDRANEEQEWDYFHPGTRCPEIELTPMPLPELPSMKEDDGHGEHAREGGSGDPAR